jgi:hypothetical protein
MIDSKSNTVRKKTVYQKTFEVDVSKETDNHLRYFIKQELGYYNAVVEQLTPRLRAFPHTIMSIKDREKKIWELCAENGVQATMLISHPVAQWPKNLQPHGGLIYELDGSKKITTEMANVLDIAASAARIHPSVRKNISSEVLRYVQAQAESFASAQKTEGFKAPVQLLTEQSLDSKRHLQIPGSLVKISYNDEKYESLIAIPYTKEPLCVPRYDLTESKFNLLVVRASSNSHNSKWLVDFKDTTSRYLLSLTDGFERRNR